MSAVPAEVAVRFMAKVDISNCRAGHRLDPTNTYTSPKGYRACRACERLRRRAYLERKRMERAA